MKWSEQVSIQLAKIKKIPVTTALAKQIFQCIDLTSLNDTDTEQTITALCHKAIAPWGTVAAVCVYPKFVKFARQQLPDSVKIAAVANFPNGDRNVNQVAEEIQQALQDGVEEMDVVFPYSGFMAGDHNDTRMFIESSKAACGNQALLKVILETGALNDLGLIADAAQLAIEAGADFIKTSTGKIPQGATLASAATMLLVIKALQPSIKRTVGFKASGGIREVPQALDYLQLAQNILGAEYVSSRTFRIGTSQLVDQLRAYIS